MPAALHEVLIFPLIPINIHDWQRCTIIVRRAGVCSTNAKWFAADRHFSVVHGLISETGFVAEERGGEGEKNDEEGGSYNEKGIIDIGAHWNAIGDHQPQPVEDAVGGPRRSGDEQHGSAIKKKEILL